MNNEERHEKICIGYRLSRIISAGAERKNLPKILSYEFGTPIEKYLTRMSIKELIQTTFNNQNSPSQLKIDAINEIESYLNLDN